MGLGLNACDLRKPPLKNLPVFLFFFMHSSVWCDLIPIVFLRLTGTLFCAQDGVRFSDAEASLLLRHIVKIGCEPGAVGMMAGGASPMDPLFWVLHPMFEKALHVLWMSPKFRDAYSFAWTDGSCDGSRLDDQLPFTGELSRASACLPACLRSVSDVTFST